MLRQTIIDENNCKNYKLNKKFRTYGVRLDVQISFELLDVKHWFQTLNNQICLGTFSESWNGSHSLIFV